MYPLRIYLHNFTNHIESNIDCTQFLSALIVGKDKGNDRKSNAAGKSNILLGIEYAIFGKTSLPLEELVKRGTNMCQVIYEFEQDGIEYQIERKRSLKSGRTQIKLSQYKNDEWEKIGGKTPSETSQAIESLIKINYDTFKNSILFEQGSFSDLAAGTEATKRKLLKEALVLGVYSKLEKNAKERKKILNNDLLSTKALIDHIGEPAADLKKLEADASILEDNIESNNKLLKTLEEKLSSYQKDKESLEKMISVDGEKLTTRLSVLLNNKNRVNTSISESSKQLNSVDDKISSSKSSINDLSLKIKEIELKQKKSVNKNDISEEDIENKIIDLEEKRQRGLKYIAKLEHDFNLYSKDLPKDANCDVCFNELTDEYRKSVSESNKEKSKTIESDVKKSKIKLEKIKTDIENYKQDIKKQQSIQKEIDHLEITLKHSKSQLANEKNHSVELDKSKKAIEKSLFDSKNELSSINEEEVKIEKELSKLNCDEVNKKIIKTNGLIENISADIKDKRKIHSDNNISKGSITNSITKKQEDLITLQNLKENSEDLTYKLKITNRVVKGFGQNGIPTVIIHTVLDDLQIEANKILADIRPELSMQFIVEKDDKDTLEITYKDNGENASYGQLSGGQKIYVSFALKFGLSLIIQKRFNVNLRFLVLDEVDQPFDDEGKDAFVNLIKRYQDKIKIFVVTHDNRLKSKFSHAILVEKDPKLGSKAKVVTQW